MLKQEQRKNETEEEREGEVVGVADTWQMFEKHDYDFAANRSCLHDRTEFSKIFYHYIQ